MKNYKLNIDKEFQFKDFSKYVLGADIGGTRTNIAVAGIKNNKLKIFLTYEFQTKTIKSIIPILDLILKDVLEKYKIEIKQACLAVAGTIEKKDSYVKLTNANLDIDINKVKKITSIKNIFLINDFQAIGYAINIIKKDELFEIKPNKTKNNKSEKKIIIGAGTGLGKSLLVYNQKEGIYQPLSSEGGHSDFPVQTDYELQLTEYIKKINHTNEPLCYEELLSGRGILNIYNFLINNKEFSENKITQEIKNSNQKTELISKYRKKDPACKKTFDLFTKFFARCVKNYALETIPFSGIYIAGGIATKNHEIFLNNLFTTEFYNSDKRRELLKKIPIYLIKNYDISLKGACFAAYKKFEENK